MRWAMLRHMVLVFARGMTRQWFLGKKRQTTLGRRVWPRDGEVLEKTRCGPKILRATIFLIARWCSKHLKYFNSFNPY